MTDRIVKRDILDYVPNSNAMSHNRLTMEAILTRDQRTTSHRVLSQRPGLENSTPGTSLRVLIENVRTNGQSARVSGSSDDGMTNETSGAGRSSRMTNSCSKRIIREYAGYRSGFTVVTWLRLGSLLVTLLVASIHAAPTMTSQTRTESQEKWVNPCMLQGAIELNDTDVTQLPDNMLLEQIILQANNALVHAEVFREEFAKQFFNLNLSQLHEVWQSQHYSWLPSTEEIPKNLGEKLDEEFLLGLDLDTALLDAYEYMQKYAVALEQLVWDQKAAGREFTKEFGDAENKLRAVLCEIQVALVERQVRQREDVNRGIMPEGFRTQLKDDSQRKTRDWLIFRDYMNGLEYVMQVFKHLLKRINS